MYTLFVDTDMDFTPEIAKEYGAKLISMPYFIDGKEIKPYIDFDVFDYKSFYDLLRTGVVPKTNAISPDEYIQYFEPEFAAGKDILYVHFSSAMSGTFNSMRIGLDLLKEKYPERNFYEVDTYAITLGSWLTALTCCQMYKEGKSIQEIQDWAEDNKFKFATYFYADDLKFFGKSGRVSGFAAFMGGIIGIKPIIHMDANGKMTAKDKCRGRKQTMARLLDYVKELQEDIASYPVYIAHCDCLELAQEFGEMLKIEFGEDLNINYYVVNPTAGGHCGPNCFGVHFRAKHR